jgi:tetratricopeptide (TPR) repeat protein
MNRYCDDRVWIASYLDRTLDAAERRSCEEHLSVCSRCRAELVAIEAELREMGLGRPAHEAIARRAARAAEGGRCPAIASLATRAIESLRPRGRAAAALAAISCAAIALVALALVAPRLVPSWDPDLRSGKADVARMLAATDFGELRLAGQPSGPADGGPVRRGAGTPGREAFDRAEASIQKALLRRPENGAAYGALGRLYLAGGEPERAANAYRRALLRSPDDPGLMNDLAVALFRSGDVEGARETLERAFMGVDAPAEICYNLAVVWRESGDREEMKRYIELYLAKDRISPWAVKARAMLSE